MPPPRLRWAERVQDVGFGEAVQPFGSFATTASQVQPALTRDDEFQPFSELMRQSAQFPRFRRREMALAVVIPKPEPVLEMFRAEAQRKMRRAEATAITRRPPRLPRPELGDLLEVRRPILNVCVKNGAQYRVLPRVRVESVEQAQDTIMASKPFIECGSGLDVHLVFMACNRINATAVVSAPAPVG